MLTAMIGNIFLSISLFLTLIQTINSNLNDFSQRINQNDSWDLRSFPLVRSESSWFEPWLYAVGSFWILKTYMSQALFPKETEILQHAANFLIFYHLVVMSTGKSAVFGSKLDTSEVVAGRRSLMRLLAMVSPSNTIHVSGRQARSVRYYCYH